MGKRAKRFNYYLSSRGISKHYAEKECKLSNGLIAKSMIEGSDLGLASIDKILSVYSDINRDWLITGEGSMLKQASQNITGNTVSGDGNILANNITSPPPMSLNEEVIRLRAQNEVLREQNSQLLAALAKRQNK